MQSQDGVLTILIVIIIYMGFQIQHLHNRVDDNFNLIDAVEADLINADGALNSDRENLKQQLDATIETVNNIEGFLIDTF